MGELLVIKWMKTGVRWGNAWEIKWVLIVSKPARWKFLKHHWKRKNPFELMQWELWAGRRPVPCPAAHSVPSLLLTFVWTTVPDSVVLTEALWAERTVTFTFFWGLGDWSTDEPWSSLEGLTWGKEAKMVLSPWTRFHFQSLIYGGSKGCHCVTNW